MTAHALGLEEFLEFFLCRYQAFVEGLAKETSANVWGEEDVEEGVAPALTSVPYSLGEGEQKKLVNIACSLILSQAFLSLFTTHA